MPSYSWLCDTCEADTELVAKIADRDVPPVALCCREPKWRRVYEAAAVTRASYVDGTKRSGFAELKEANKLSQESAVSPSAERRREIAKEIKKLGVRVTKG